jgi:hypothetical protein
MSDDELELRIRFFVADALGVKASSITGATDLIDDLGTYGDDVWELIGDFSEEFKVDITGFRWYHHTGPEGCNPFWLLFKPWWARKTHVPVRLSDLASSVRLGKWAIPYPEHEREP